jgi:hypothetical protein
MVQEDKEKNISLKISSTTRPTLFGRNLRIGISPENYCLATGRLSYGKTSVRNPIL